MAIREINGGRNPPPVMALESSFQASAMAIFSLGGNHSVQFVYINYTVSRSSMFKSFMFKSSVSTANGESRISHIMIERENLFSILNCSDHLSRQLIS